jgi:uncharacterized OB-fold protein
MKIQYGELILDQGERSIRPDIFSRVEGDPTPHLLARQCRDCGDISFPPFRYCLKCNCKGETVEKVMSNEGVLASYTIARQVMPGFNPDYVLANVRMKDDPTLVLVAQLTDIKTEDVAIDMELTMVPKIIKVLMNGEKVVSYCFRPKDPAKVTRGEGGQTE